jgi:hypothetical protein
MSKEDLIVLCEEAIDDLESRKISGIAWENLFEIRAALIEGKVNE